MTVGDYLKKINDYSRKVDPEIGISLYDEALKLAEVWSEAAAEGYIILALKDLGIDRKTAFSVLYSFRKVAIQNTLEEAEDACCKGL